MYLPKHEPVPLWSKSISDVVVLLAWKCLLMDEYKTPKANCAPFPNMNIRKAQMRTTQDQPESTSLHLSSLLITFVCSPVSSLLISNIGNSSLNSSVFISVNSSLHADPMTHSTKTSILLVYLCQCFINILTGCDACKLISWNCNDYSSSATGISVSTCENCFSRQAVLPFVVIWNNISM